jgi:NADH:ubiquinone oxidoreductase subunit E
MVNVTVCIGSSCHLKGSRAVVERLKQLLDDSALNDAVKLGGAFCMGKCSGEGVNVTVDGTYFAVTPQSADDFFKNEILPRVKSAI